ncbi:MAG: T9SS type A sorting domain-containing protein [Prolixibacteraceae bacterium]
MRKRIIAILVILTAATFNSVNAQDVNINFSEEQQIIRGFGGINFPAWIGDLNQDMREKAFSNQPGEIGLSILRMQVPPDSTQFNREIPTAEYAASQGATLFASPWNPPTNMSEVKNETDRRLLPEFYDDYVGHLNSFVAYMDKNKVPLYAISVQNEPDWHGWTTWTPNEMLTFVKNNAQDINCRVIAPESLGYVRSTIDPLLKDSVANSHIDILGTHLYGTPVNNYYYPLVYEKGKEIWMTEHLWGSDKPEDNTWELALDIAEEINTCMDAQMSAFVYWYIRRFYGLIDETGNITDKGYVMSQFAKFIRPGFHRVKTNFKPASKVTATAYKSDSSMVIVVVNKNSNAVDLNLVFQNNDLASKSLTKFTTSASKKLVNDGSLSLDGESIAITVDANSITTFTSDPSKGAKYGNQPPVAYLGEVVEVEFKDLQDVTEIEYELLGSESKDPDGEIVKYSWAQDGKQISIEPDLSLTLGIGIHTYVLTVTDNDGATATSTVTINVATNNTEEIWLEAECADVGANWNIAEDKDASNGKSIGVKIGIQSTAAASADVADHLVYNFQINEGGNYKVWARVLAPSYDDDSYWVKVDDGEWVNWNGLAENSGWAWNDVNDGSNLAIIYALDTGSHSLSVCYREDGASLDKFYITNTGLIPEGIGNDANNCVEEIDSTNAVNDVYFNKDIKVYPNPVQTEFYIESQVPYTSIELFDVNGRRVFVKNYVSSTYNDDVVIDLQNGVYVLRLLGNENVTMTRFVVNRF